LEKRDRGGFYIKILILKVFFIIEDTPAPLFQRGSLNAYFGFNKTLAP